MTPKKRITITVDIIVIKEGKTIRIMFLTPMADAQRLLYMPCKRSDSRGSRIQ